MNTFYNMIKLVVLSLILPACLSCSKDDSDGTDYSADFSFELDPTTNQVTFTNQSSGEYLYVEWDFGNDQSIGKSTDKDKVHSIYYPEKGEYDVTLKVWGVLNTSADTKTMTKMVTIETDDPDYVNPEGLIWSDEFNTATINSANWTYEIGHGDWGWGNNELQYYTNGDNAEIIDGKLVLTAKKVDDNKTQGSYTSTRMISKGKQEFTYGRIEVRAKLPSGTGVWPAIWMLGANIGQVGWPACGEIDIMEYVGFEPDVVHATVHCNAGSGANGNGSSKALKTGEEAFHIYGLIWTEASLTFYVDTPDNVVHVYAPADKNENNWPFNKPHFFIMNIAVGGTWGGSHGIDNTIFPQTMEIDYVRVYELDD
ncbi:MAG: family 16 glycosylhydrolase [Carboxylicivirga sp.]|nr:family 16 glycosylhydrolase [Carboxylicivirga sp.]